MAGREDRIRTRDINKASIGDISNLPFMNEQRARLIIAYRDANGPFKHIDDVDNVTGIGEKLSQLVKQHFQVGEGDESGENDNEEEGGAAPARRVAGRRS